MAAEHEAALIAAARTVEQRRASLREKLKGRAAQIQRYRRLFMEDGKLTPDAVHVIGDLAVLARFGRVLPPEMTDAEMRHVNGQRDMLLRLMARLDLSGAELDSIARQLRET